MLNNAEPRIISNGFDLFVANNCMMPVQETFFEMNNNAWSIVSHPPTPKSWEQNVQNFRDHKNFPLIQSEEGDFYQDTTPLSPDHISNSQRAPTYAAIHERQQSNKGQSFSLPLHPVPTMNHDYGSSPTLGIDYSQMSMNQGRGSFVAFKNCRTSTPLSMAQFSFSSNTSIIEDHISSDHTSPSTIYSDLSTLTNITPNTYNSIGSRSPIAHDGAVSNWCLNGIDNHMKIIDNLTSEVCESCGISDLHDGLPRPQDEQQESFGGVWHHTYDPKNNWPPNPLIPDTVRPKALSLNESFASTISIATSESSQTSTYSSSESTTVASSPGDTSKEEQLVVEQTSQSHRHMLPSSRPTENNDAALPGLSNNRTVQDRANKLHWATSRPVKNRRARASTPIISAVANTRSHTMIKKDLDTRDFIVPTTPQDDVSEGITGVTDLRNRSEQNKFLVSSRRAGMSYKKIRYMGGFTDAESTLRGRFRTLTKDKKDRVRRPKWTDNDLRLLSKAVKELGRSTPNSWEPKVEWKKVAEYIADNGGSYRFGYATCRKRWLEIEDLD